MVTVVQFVKDTYHVYILFHLWRTHFHWSRGHHMTLAIIWCTAVLMIFHYKTVIVYWWALRTISLPLNGKEAFYPNSTDNNCIFWYGAGKCDNKNEFQWIELLRHVVYVGRLYQIDTVRAQQRHQINRKIYCPRYIDLSRVTLAFLAQYQRK